MKHSGTFAICLVIIATLVSGGCHDAVHTGRATVPYVEEILTSQGWEWDVLSSFDPRDSRGSITVLDQDNVAASLVERFLKVDAVDNIDGRARPDGLPDFAGEQIDVLDDDSNPSYASLFGTDDSSLRTLNVENFISAMDTACSLGAFDDEKLQRKLQAKVVVFSSPYLALDCAFDIDTLRRSTGCSVPVIFPSRLVFGQQLDRKIEHLHVAVVTDSLTAASGIYPKVFGEVSGNMGILGTGCVAVPCDSSSTINTVLARYKSAGGNMPISAIVIDDNSLDAAALAESLNETLNVNNEENLNARKLITKDLVIVDIDKAVTDECYRILRKNNIFTHNISYPVSRDYMTVKSSAGYGIRLVEKD